MCVCLSAGISPAAHVQTSRSYLQVLLSVAVAQFISDGNTIRYELPGFVNYWQISHHSRRRMLLARDKRRLLYFGRVFLSFPTIDFSTSLGRFSRNCHTTWCTLKYSIPIYGCSYVPPKNLRSENPHFSLIPDPKSTL